MDHVESLAYSRLVGGVPRLSVPIGLGEVAGLCWWGGGILARTWSEHSGVSWFLE